VYSPIALLWPFHIQMWGAIFASTLIAFIVFKLITKLMKLLRLEDYGLARRGIVSNNVWGIKDQIFFVTTTYLDQVRSDTSSLLNRVEQIKIKCILKILDLYFSLLGLHHAKTNATKMFCGFVAILYSYHHYSLQVSLIQISKIQPTTRCIRHFDYLA